MNGLRDLLLGIFTSAELRTFIGRFAPALAVKLPGDTTSHMVLVDGVVAALVGHRLLNAELFCALRGARPNFELWIAAVESSLEDNHWAARRPIRRRLHPDGRYHQRRTAIDEPLVRFFFEAGLDDRPRICVLHGTRRSGKTKIAEYFAATTGEQFRICYWMDLQDGASIRDLLAVVAWEDGFRKGTDDENLRRWQRALQVETPARYLFVLDGADPELVRDALQWFPCTQRCCLLVTCNIPPRDLGRALWVGPLNDTEGVSLLRGDSPDAAAPPQAAELRLCEALGWHAWSIVRAREKMASSGRSVEAMAVWVEEGNDFVRAVDERDKVIGQLQHQIRVQVRRACQDEPELASCAVDMIEIAARFGRAVLGIGDLHGALELFRYPDLNAYLVTRAANVLVEHRHFERTPGGFALDAHVRYWLGRTADEPLSTELRRAVAQAVFNRVRHAARERLPSSYASHVQTVLEFPGVLEDAKLRVLKQWLARAGRPRE